MWFYTASALVLKNAARYNSIAQALRQIAACADSGRIKRDGVFKIAIKNVELFTDGACSGNPGPGGWCAILRYKGHERVLSGGERNTTNNRMELTAVIEGLGVLTERCAVTIYSDSKYFIDAIDKGWLGAWRQRGWRKADKSPVLNIDLWQRIEAETSRHSIKLVWVKGHDGHPENERCDQIAVAESKKWLASAK